MALVRDDVGTPTSPLEESVTLKQLFPRESCATCPDTSPSCPDCPSGQICQITVPLTCSECSRSYCAIDTSAQTSTGTSSSKPNAGAIAGGVCGGLAMIGLLTYLVWRFCIKTKRNSVYTKEDEYMPHESVAGGNVSFSTRRDQRASTHTAHSIASTVLTRASNIIQIAYIPGVMNRASPTSPNILVPPVPPIPIAVSSASQPSTPAGPDDHFFVPGDLRDSTYSGYSGFSDRTSMARTSYAPRSSIASTIYGKNAVIVAPPQTGMRAKPTMVNLKSPNAIGITTPPVPSVDFEKYNNPERPVSAANSTFSVGSTFLNNASAAMPVRPVVVSVGSGLKKSPLNNSDSVTESVKSVSIVSVKGSAISAASPTEDKKAPPSSAGRISTATTIIEDSPSPDQGPFSDPPASSSSQKPASKLNAVAEEPSRRTSERDSTGSERGRSPFSDEHATHD